MKATQKQIEHLKKVHKLRSEKARSTPEFYAAKAFYETNNCDSMTLSEVAFLLNEAGHKTPRGRIFCNAGVLALRKKMNHKKSTTKKFYPKNLYDFESYKIYGKPMASLKPDERIAVRSAANKNVANNEITNEELVEMILSLCEFQYRKGVQQGHSMAKRGIITEKQAYDFRYKDKTYNRAKCVLGGKGQYSIIRIIEMERFVSQITFKQIRTKDKFIHFLKKYASEKQKEIYKNGGV